MTTLSLSIPQAGSPDATEEPKLASDMTALQNWANGNVDSDNLSAATSQAAGINTAGTKVKGTVFNAGPGTRTNTAYGALGDAADQVTGITLATNGLLRVWFQAGWQESVANAARAAIFIGSNQLKVQAVVLAQAVTQAALTNQLASSFAPLHSFAAGLISPAANNGIWVSGDVNTGQAIASIGFGPANVELNAGSQQLFNSGYISLGGPVDIFAAAGTYTISVQYKASSGSVSAKNRHLWCQAISFD